MESEGQEREDNVRLGVPVHGMKGSGNPTTQRSEMWPKDEELILVLASEGLTAAVSARFSIEMCLE